jgi:hypothetical protein
LGAVLLQSLQHQRVKLQFIKKGEDLVDGFQSNLKGKYDTLKVVFAFYYLKYKIWLIYNI